MVSRPTLEDLFEIEYSETDPHWFIIKAKPEFEKHRIRFQSIRARFDFHHGKGTEDISIMNNSDRADINEKFNTLVLTRYDKSPEQGYYGRTEFYIEAKEVKNEHPWLPHENFRSSGKRPRPQRLW